MFHTNSINLYQVLDSMMDDFDYFFSDGFKTSSIIPKESSNYPVFDLYVDKETKATTIKVAVTDFEDDEVEVKRDGNYLIISATSKEIDVSNRKYLNKGIAKRDFKKVFSISDKIDWDKLDVSMKKGTLTIVLNLKDEEKPVQQTFQISRN